MTRGGSNYNWTAVDCCDREPYGALKEGYHQPKIQQQLKAMYDSGQRRLRIMIYHAPEGQGTGTVLVPLDPVEEWLGAFLADIKAAGFEEIMVAMGPQGEMDIGYRWGMVRRVMDAAQDSGVFFKIDLVNEGSVPEGHTRFTMNKAIWNEYRQHFSRETTVGFSIPLDHRMADRIASLDELYSGDLPYLFSVHSYGYVTDEYTELVWLDNLLNEHGHSQGIIIGECYYNDEKSAKRIHDAAKDLSRPVYYLLQWPMTRYSLCKQVDVAPPIDFSEYIKRGF